MAKKPAKMKAAKVWAIVMNNGTVWDIFITKSSAVAWIPFVPCGIRIVGPITIREPRPRKGKQ